MRASQTFAYLLATVPSVSGLSAAHTPLWEARGLALKETQLLMDPRYSALQTVVLVGKGLAHRNLNQDRPSVRAPVVDAGHAAVGSRPADNPDNFIIISKRAYWILLMSYFVTSGILIALVAWLYRRAKVWPEVDPTKKFTTFTKFASGPFDCFQDTEICLWSCICPCIRWADNMSMVNILNFWVALALMSGLWLLDNIMGGMIIWMLCAFVWMVFRRKFRQKFDMQRECSVLMADCVLYFFCMPCAIAQEARQLELACKADHELVKEQRPKVDEIAQS